MNKIPNLYNEYFIKKNDERSELFKILSDKFNIKSGLYPGSFVHITPSFFISHQIRIMNPLRLKMFESGSEIFNLFFFKRFRGVIVPDFKEDSLSGDLSHNLKKIDEDKINFVGVLSDFRKKRCKKDIDYFISISGPEPQRSIFEKTLLSQIPSLDGNIIVTFGKVESVDKFKLDNVTGFSFLSKEEREDFLNRSKLVISRSGYSTILDLAVIGTKALMIPTSGQIEQLYLGQYHNEKRTFFSVNQDKLLLERDVEIAKKTTGITRRCNVSKTVENVLDIIYFPGKSPFG